MISTSAGRARSAARLSSSSSPRRVDHAAAGLDGIPARARASSEASRGRPGQAARVVVATNDIVDHPEAEGRNADRPSTTTAVSKSTTQRNAAAVSRKPRHLTTPRARPLSRRPSSSSSSSSSRGAMAHRALAATTRVASSRVVARRAASASPLLRAASRRRLARDDDAFRDAFASGCVVARRSRCRSRLVVLAGSPKAKNKDSGRSIHFRKGAERFNTGGVGEGATRGGKGKGKTTRSQRTNKSYKRYVRRVLVYTPVPIRPRRRGERRSLKTFFTSRRFSPPRVPRFQSRHTSTPFNSASDAFQLRF